MATRDDIVLEALEWQGTVFHDCASMKGIGTDCAGLLKGVFVAVGLVKDFAMPGYKPQWFQHKDEPLFLKALQEHGARKIDPKDALPGDVLMYNFGRHAAHGAIVVNERTIVHAYKPVGAVTLGDRAEFAHRLDSAWTLFP